MITNRISSSEAGMKVKVGFRSGEPPGGSVKAFQMHLNKVGSPKVPYTTLEEAVEAANSESIRLRCFRMVPYFCDYCRSYHIGKPPYRTE